MWADWKVGAIKATQGHRSWPVCQESGFTGSCREPPRAMGVSMVLGQASSEVHGEVGLTSPSISYRENVSLLWVAHAWGKVDKGSVSLPFLFSSMCLHLFLCFI